MKKTIITIARQHGSGGRLIGKKVAENLGIEYYDKEIINMVAKEAGTSSEFIHAIEDRKPTSFLFDLYMSSSALSLYDQAYMAQSKVILDLASKGSCVIIGRCADYVLDNFDNCVNVFIHAPEDERCKRILNEYKEVSENAEKYIRKRDKERASYYNFTTGRKWGESRNYDLTINSTIGIDATADIICNYAKMKVK